MGADQSGGAIVGIRNANLWLGASAGLALLPTTVFIVISSLFVLGLQINTPLAAAILIAAFFLSLWAAYTVSRQALACVLVVLAVLAAGLFSHALIDTTYDGQWYHFHGAFALAQGWNPFWEPLPEAPWETAGADLDSRLWVAHYPQATWRVAAVQMAAGLGQETAKAANPILACAMLFGFIGIGLRLTSSAWVVLPITVAFAANPVIIAQLPTRYVDGSIAACFALTAMFAFAWIESRKLVFAAAMFAVIAFALNLKFLTVPVFAMLCALLTVAVWLRGNRQDAIRFASIALVAGIAGVLLFGFEPYVRNTLDFHHPFYPVMGPNHVDVVGGMYPTGFEQLPEWQKFLFSIFSQTAVGHQTPFTLKFPFTVSSGEIQALGAPDARLGGFGPLFSASLVCALIAAAFNFVLDRGNRKFAIYFGAAAALFVSAVAMPESWWARYAPQLWWVPALIATALLFSSIRSLRVAGIVVVAIMGLNGALATYTMMRTGLWASRTVTAELGRIKQTNVPVMAYVGHSPARFGLIAETGVGVSAIWTLPERCVPHTLAHAMGIGVWRTPSYCSAESSASSLAP